MFSVCYGTYVPFLEEFESNASMSSTNTIVFATVVSSFAFFYITNTVAASQGQHFKKISEIRQNMTEFRTQWINFNQPIDGHSRYPGHMVKPTVLVVADEIFTMGDKQLSMTARLSVPNTLRESNLVKNAPLNHNDPSSRNPQTLY